MDGYGKGKDSEPDGLRDAVSVLRFARTVFPAVRFKKSLGRNFLARGRMEGTLAHIIAVPTSATDQLRELMQLSKKKSG